MLEGKPSRDDEATTMRAIKDILSECDAEIRPLHEHNAAPIRRRTDELTLTPVKPVDDNLRPAKFTTIPTGYVPEKKIEVMRRPLNPETPVQRERPQAAARVAPAPAPAPEPMPKPRADRKRGFALRSVLPRISPRWPALAVLLYCAMVYPILIVAPLFVALTVIIGVFAIFGADRVWNDVSRGLAAYEKRKPAKAKRLLKRLDAFAMRWDAVLDRFPEGWVDGLYLPDFANRDVNLRRDEDMIAARLNRMHSQV